MLTQMLLCDEVDSQEIPYKRGEINKSNQRKGSVYC